MVKRLYRRSILFLSMILLSVQSIGEGNEYSLKAMFILNFIKYVEWPASSGGEIRIAIVGKSEIKEALLSTLKKKSANSNQKVNVIEIDDDEIVPCEILFVPAAESHELSGYQKDYAGKGVLIISESTKSNTKGAAINLINVDNKIRFEIYQSQAKSAGVKISSRLTELAANVYP